MRFGLLGPLAVWGPDGALVRVPGAKVRALLAVLLLHEGRPVSADRLIDDLWGEDLPGNPAGALQAKVSQLRRVLGDTEPDGRALVESRPAGYVLRVGAEAVDTERFAALVSRAGAGTEPGERAALLTEALGLFRGPVCADFADEVFVQAAVTRWEEQRVTAVEDLAEARLELGEHRLLVGELAILVEQYPLRERLRAAQIRALYQSGRQSEALAEFDRLRCHLSAELGLDPSPELIRLHQAVLEQDPELQAAPAAPASAARPRTNLPAPLLAGPHGGLVGREDAIADVRAKLGAGRLVTLSGPGGVGKTRLAVETAAQSAEGFPGGAWLVELASRRHSANTVETLAGAVASTLGIREDAGLGVPHGGEYVGPVDRLAGALRAKSLLLLLDNCEHVIEAAAELAEMVLGVAPDVRILATSQEPLGLSGELVYPVQPLELPDTSADLTVLAQTPAVRLFTARAAAAAPGFVLAPDNARAVAAICRRLDGIPLALELAATRVRALGVHDLAARLDDRFRLLTAGHRNAPARQQTLRAMMDWSWELLTPEEQAVLRRLAVHADGCTLAAAEEVCADHDVPAADVLDLLARLVDRSLVTATDDLEHRPSPEAAGRRAENDSAHSAPNEGGAGKRYRLLESVAAYCVGRLVEADEVEAVQARHAEFYARMAERAEPQLRGHGQREWLERLDAEEANLRAAIDSAVRRRSVPLALRLVNALAWYWLLRGRHGEARRSLSAALALEGGAPDTARAAAMSWSAGIAFMAYESDPVAQSRAALSLYDVLDAPDGRARALWVLAFCRSGSGELSDTVRLAGEALAAFRRNSDQWGIAAALSTRADLALVQGDLATAGRDSEAGEALFRELGDRWGQVYAAKPRAMLAEITGDHALAARLHRRSLRMAEELRLWPSVSEQLAKLGRLALLAGDFEGSDDFHEKARRLAVDQANGSGTAFAVTGLALSARRQGRLDTAEEHLRGLLDWNRRTAYQPGVAFALTELGFVAELRGDAAAAERWHAEGLAVSEESGDPRAIALSLEGAAGVSALTGAHERAASLLGTAAAARESVRAPLPPEERGDVDRISAVVRGALGHAGFAAAFERGRVMEPDARSGDDSGPTERT